MSKASLAIVLALGGVLSVAMSQGPVPIPLVEATTAEPKEVKKPAKKEGKKTADKGPRIHKVSGESFPAEIEA
ncbi:MAG: hypothetical protein AAF492_15720, partial [Verrucomicrobiota bacterium]